MTDLPKLTDRQAALLRYCTFDPWADTEDRELAEDGLVIAGDETCPTIILQSGRAALAAYDAEQRRKIRAEAIAECLDAIMTSSLPGDTSEMLESVMRAVASVKREVKP